MSDFGQKLQGLLGDPTFNLGIGLLAAGGQRRGPRVSFGQGLMEATQFANQQSQAYNQLQAQRNQLQAQKQRQNAMKGIQGLLGPQPPASIAAPAGVQAQRLQGLLAQANPQAYTNSLIQSQFAQPNTPAIPREAALARQMFPDEPLETSLPKAMAILNPQDPEKDLQLRKLLLEVDNMMAERRGAQEAEQVSTANAQSSIDNSIGTIGKIANNLETIKGSFLQPGAPLAGIRRGASGLWTLAGDVIGFNTQKTQEMNTAADNLGKDLNSLVLETLENFGQDMTNQQTALLRSSMASNDITPQAIADVLQTSLDVRIQAAANDPDLTIKDMEEIQQIREQLNQIKTFGAPQRRVNWQDLNQRNSTGGRSGAVN